MQVGSPLRRGKETCRVQEISVPRQGTAQESSPSIADLHVVHAEEVRDGSLAQGCGVLMERPARRVCKGTRTSAMWISSLCLAEQTAPLASAGAGRKP